MAKRPAVLVTRPEPGATDLAGSLKRTLDAQVFSAPLTEIVPTDAAIDPGDATALLVTSPKAAQLASSVPDLPVFAVGRTSAEAARARGLHVQSVGSARVDDALIASLPAGARVLHLSGEDLAVDPAPLLAARGITYARLVVYRAESVEEPPPALRACLAADAPRFVTFLSGRAAEIFAALAPAAMPAASSIPPVAP